MGDTQWGWGHEDVTFDDSTKPELWPYLKRELGVDEATANVDPRQDQYQIDDQIQYKMPSVIVNMSQFHSHNI